MVRVVCVSLDVGPSGSTAPGRPGRGLVCRWDGATPGGMDACRRIRLQDDQRAAGWWIPVRPGPVLCRLCGLRHTACVRRYVVLPSRSDVLRANGILASLGESLAVVGRSWVLLELLCQRHA